MTPLPPPPPLALFRKFIRFGSLTFPMHYALHCTVHFETAWWLLNDILRSAPPPYGQHMIQNCLTKLKWRNGAIHFLWAGKKRPPSPPLLANTVVNSHANPVGPPSSHPSIPSTTICLTITIYHWPISKVTKNKIRKIRTAIWFTPYNCFASVYVHSLFTHSILPHLDFKDLHYCLYVFKTVAKVSLFFFRWHKSYQRLDHNLSLVGYISNILGTNSTAHRGTMS